MPRRSSCLAISSPSSALMKATSSTMNTPGSAMRAMSSAAAPAQVPGGQVIIKAVRHLGRGARPLGGDRARHLGQRAVLGRGEQLGGGALALALQHDVDGAFPVREHVL